MDELEILDPFFARSENAISAIQSKFGRYCHYIAVRILGNDSDAQEVVNDTWLKAWNTIPPHRPNSLKTYLGMLTRQLALDAWDVKTAQKRGGQFSLVLDELAECIPDGTDFTQDLELRDALNRFLHTLPSETRRIFLRRYWYAASVAEIAREFHMKKSTVTVLMLRTRQKLKAFLQKEEIFL